jgi:uncharacterized protein (DUF1499 family)
MCPEKELTMNDATTATSGKSDGKWTSRLAYAAAVILVISLVVGQTGMSAFGAMSGISLAILLGLIAFIIVLIGAIKSKSLSGLNTAGWIAVAFGVIAFYTLAGMFGSGGPPIHDISTDTQDPPAFIAVAELRSENENPVDYLDDGTAEKQAEAYPDIRTIFVQEDVDTAFARAFAAAQSMGWEIVANEPTEGRIEATATTPFVGFKDDVVIRVRADGAGALIDIRSKSRIGRGDMGVNAKRIRAFQAEINPDGAARPAD